MWKFRPLLLNSFALAVVAQRLFFGELAWADNGSDYTGLTTPVCEVQGLYVKPPTGWINVPVDTAEQPLRGCQMMLIEEETYLGIIRIFSHDIGKPGEGKSEQWEAYLVEFETLLLADMGFKRGDVLWKKDSMPVSGEGFYGGKAIGFGISIENFDVPWEVHFVIFQSDHQHYLISLVSPSESASDGGSLYRENSAAMGFVMRTLQPVPKS